MPPGCAGSTGGRCGCWATGTKTRRSRRRAREMSEPLAWTFDDDGVIPNSRLPLLVYRDAVPADAAGIERLFAANRWPPAWRDGVHPFHHFHSTAHEVLGVARGEASVLFGGPGGTVLEVWARDV